MFNGKLKASKELMELISFLVVQWYRKDEQNSKFLTDSHHPDFIFDERTSFVDSDAKYESSIFFFSTIRMQINKFA